MSQIIVHVTSLGCAKNLVDTEVMCGAIVSSGMFIAERPEDANVRLINTCSFIKDARDEAERHIREALTWKRAARGQRRAVVVAGCLAQRYPNETRRRFPGIDLLLGLDDVPHAADLIRQALEGDGATHAVNPALPTYLYDETTPRLPVTPGSYAYLKIAEGCDHQCAFCAIPLFRGRQRSRSVASVLAECRQLLNLGVKEINLIAQDSSRYGLERGDGASLTALLREIDRLDGDFWVRVLYTHPLHTGDDLLETLASSRHVVPYLDMPIQHVATNVLQAMRRGMTGPQLTARLRDIRRNFPSLTLRTTVLLGFPGETDDDFRQLLDFVQDFRFDRLGAFAFSPEDGTPAMRLLADAPDTRTAELRRDAILETQLDIAAENNRRLVGKTQSLLLEEQLDATHWLARSQADAPEVDQTITVASRRKRPAFISATITAAHDCDLEARETPAH